MITGFVKSAELCSPLSNVRVTRTGPNGNTFEVTESDVKGRFQFEKVDPKDTIRFEKVGFVNKTIDGGNFSEIIRLLEDQLIGYQKKLWFIPGENIEVYVNSPTQFSARLYRHGITKQCVIDLGIFDSFFQALPDSYFVDMGLNWVMNFSYRMPENAVPGIYSLLLEAEGQEPFAIPMVVSTPKNKRGKLSKLLVLASTNTWQSYNIWGGRSRYRNFEISTSSDFANLNSVRHKIKMAVAKRLPLAIKSMIRHALKHGLESEAYKYRKLSVVRPFTNCSLEDQNVYNHFTNHLAAGEWRVLAWLEREKIDYDIVSGADLHREPDLLQHYRAILFSTHCEYWTREMYEGLKKHHQDNNLWILNLSGNTMYREIEFFKNGSTRCVSLSFASSCADESKILGVRFTEDDLSTCAPYRIIEPDHWVFKNISGIDKFDKFGGMSLNRNTPKTYSRYDPGRPGDKVGLVGSGASGWETDKLSRTAPKDIVPIAKGLNKKGGADMVIREPNGSRGGMFSASSITFGGTLLIDKIASKLTQNVISRALGS
jgi:hypothetical protein